MGILIRRDVVERPLSGQDQPGEPYEADKDKAADCQGEGRESEPNPTGAGCAHLEQGGERRNEPKDQGHQDGDLVPKIKTNSVGLTVFHAHYERFP